MGGSASLPAGLDHQQLFDMTKDTRLIMNKLLDYGLHKITVSEFVKLSSPEGSKKYVMFLANSIHKLFYELQVEPGTDKRGVIFFRSIKDLTEPTAQEKVERQSLCLTLAYFYTRIFQIYGSIALTLIDDINDISQIGIFDGTDQTTGVSVDQNNCIKNRLYKLIIYLQQSIKTYMKIKQRLNMLEDLQKI